MNEENNKESEIKIKFTNPSQDDKVRLPMLFIKTINLIKENKLIAIGIGTFLVILLSTISYFNNNNAQNNGYYCMFKVYQEEDKYLATKGEGDEWELTADQAKWVKENCPETVWTTKAEEAINETKTEVEVEEAKKITPKTETKTESVKQETKKNCDFQFTQPYTDVTKLAAIQKLGSFQGGSPGRSYNRIKIEEGEVPIYAPADATLEIIIYAPRSSETAPEYGLYFDTGCNIRFLLDHIDRVTDEIKALAPQAPADSTRTELGTKPNKEIKAGTLIGYTDGTPQAQTFDFLVFNYGVKTDFINPSRWTNDQAKHAVCPYNYYVPPYREQFLAKIGTSPGTFIAEDCGTPSQDIAGTLSGGWFKEASTDLKGDFLGIGQNSARAEIVIRKDSAFTDVNMLDWSTNKMPKDVKVGESACYHDWNKDVWAFVRLDTDTKISFAHGGGACPAAFPEAQAETWER